MNRETIITSRQNPLVKTVCALSEKKRRRETGLFRFDGAKLLEEAVHRRLPLTYVLVSESAPHLMPMAERAVAEGLLPPDGLFCVGASAFEKMSEERAPEGVIAVAKMPKSLHRTVSSDALCELVGRDKRILLAESLRDPGNLGTVLRSASALGIDYLVLSDDCAELGSPKTLRAAMGAMFCMPTLTVESLPEAIGALRRSGRRVYATALHREAAVIGQLTLSRGDCFVIGNEGHGLSETVIAACDGAAIIPMREGSESLNAAAAAAICIWETVRA